MHYLDYIKKKFCTVFECSIQGPSVRNSDDSYHSRVTHL